MAYRFLVALLFSLAVFPFVAIWTFSLEYPDARFAFDKATWLQGLAIVGFGWILFLLPGLIPVAGERYYGWVARKTGLVSLVESMQSGVLRVSSAIRAFFSSCKTRLSAFGPLSSLLARTRSPRTPHRVSADGSIEASHAVSQAVDPSSALRSRRPQIPHLQLERAKGLLTDAPRHLAKARETLNGLRGKLTPDELQKTIDLNQYTLEAFAHLKVLLESLLPLTPLDEPQHRFAVAVISAIPEPPSPSASQEPSATHTFVYPLDDRDNLRTSAGKRKVVLRDTDFELAAQGDLERALFVLKALVVSQLPSTRSYAHLDENDPMIGLLASTEAAS